MTVERLLTAIASLLAFLALLPSPRVTAPGGRETISALEVAKAIRADPEGTLILDIRNEEAFAELHLPRAIHFPIALDSRGLETKGRPAWLDDLPALGATADRPIVIAGDSTTPNREVWLELRNAGYRASHMPAMLDDWIATIVSPVRGPTEDPRILARWAAIGDLSRYYGGLPRVLDDSTARDLGTAERLSRARRRGCAF